MSEKMQASGLIEVIPLIGTLAIWSQYPAFLHPDSPQGAPLGVAAGLVAGSLFVSILSSLRAHRGQVAGCSVEAVDGFNILCLLIWQATFLVHR